MPGESKFSGWKSIISSVKTPLGFFTLIVLSVDVLLFGTSALTGKVSMWAPIALFALVIMMFFVIVWKKPYVLYQPGDWQSVTVNLVFPEEIKPFEVDFQERNCVLEIRSIDGQKKHGGAPNLTLGHGGWTLHLYGDIGPSDTIKLELKDNAGRKWRVSPFRAYETEKNVFQV